MSESETCPVGYDPPVIQFLWETEKHLLTEMRSYSDDSYYAVEFVAPDDCDDIAVDSALAAELYKKRPPSHFGGCRSSWTLMTVDRSTMTATIVHYAGIGD
jgi:hypothetical protein